MGVGVAFIVAVDLDKDFFARYDVWNHYDPSSEDFFGGGGGFLFDVAGK